MNLPSEQISIIGAGSWGNTLAFLLGQQQKVILWDHNPSRVRIMNKTRRFKKPIKHKYPDNVLITSNLGDVLDSRIIINAVSLKGMAEVFANLKMIGLRKDHILVSASKGIDSTNLKTPTEIIDSFCPDNPKAVISGPNLARELIKGQPMVTEVAAHDPEIASLVQEKILSATLRVYINNDVKGVELCGALKNVIAIAAGCSDGLKLGESAKASLITRGLKEMGIFLKLYGCKSETLLGPAGVGDLVATCSSNLSRNYRVGFLLTEGKKLDWIIEKLGEVAEGVNTTHAVYKICQENNLEMPIVEEIKKLLDDEITPVDAVLNLMKRPIKKPPQ
jgi:glycerol-3-phosphate dehydrogenase (NAD(P)+)